MNIRMIAWIAFAAILLVILAVLGPWGSDSNPSSFEPGVTLNNEADVLPAPVLKGEAAPSNGSIISRTAVGENGENLSVFTIREIDGEPVVDTRVLLCRDESLLLSTRSDSNGKVEFASDHQKITLVVKAPGRPIFTDTFQLVPGPIEVLLPRGTVLSGKVFNHDGTDPTQLSVRLNSDNPLFDFNSLPKGAQEELEHLTRYNGIRTSTSHPGAYFRFAGLPESWSGFLRFDSGIMIANTSGGKLLASGNEIRFDAPQADLIIELAKRKVIKGRLVEHESNDPLGMIPITARYQLLLEEAPQTLNFTSDKRGDFLLKIDPERLASLELFLGSHPQEDQTILRLSGAEIPPDGNLGNVVVTSLRTIRFVLQNKNAQGIAGGYARAGGLRSKVSNPSGEGFLHWLSADVTHIRFLAPGYVPQDQELNELTPDPLVVTMDSGNRLELEIITPAGAEVDQFRAELKSDAMIINGPAKDLNELYDYVGEESRPYYQAPDPQPGARLLARPNFDDLIVFQSLRSDVELNLKILGITGNSVFHSETLQPLGAQEIRRHVIDLRQAGSVFHGRVTDLNGNPLVRATVQLSGQILAWTDSSGEFSCLVNEPEAKTLVLSHRSSATLFVHDYLVPTHGAAVEFRLEPARRVIIEVVDETGAAIADAQLYILREGFTSSTHSLGEGRFEASGLSSEGVRVQAMVAGKFYVQDLNPDESTAQVIVPIHGSLAVEFLPQLDLGEGQYSVVIKALAKEHWIELTKVIEAAGEWGCEFPLVLPGQYEATVTYSPSPQELQDGMSLHTIGDAVTISIEPGQRSQLRLK